MGAPVVSIVGGDFNNDGIGDFAVSYGTSGLAVFLGRPDGTLTRKDILNGSAMGGDNFLAAADVNGDHKLDLVGYGPVIMFGNGDGTFQDPFIPVVPRDPASGQSGVIGVADFDGDGIPIFWW
jgi:hypothetical protein